MASAELIAAVEQLMLEQPGLGAKKVTAAVKASHPDLKAGTKEVRAALAEVKASASPAVSPSASPTKLGDGAGDGAGDGSAAAEQPKEESARQAKARERREAAAAQAKLDKERAKRKNAAFKKLFPELDLRKAFGKGVDRRLQQKCLDEIKEKLTDQSYLTSVLLEGRLEAEEMKILVEDMRASGFKPSGAPTIIGFRKPRRWRFLSETPCSPQQSRRTRRATRRRPRGRRARRAWRARRPSRRGAGCSACPASASRPPEPPALLGANCSVK
eukprot:COSAG04_NODE_809_length_10142_cov_3.378174_17_plen_272_part_00